VGGLAYYMAKLPGQRGGRDHLGRAAKIRRAADLDVTILLQDYRDLHESDRIVSVGMFEHVGLKITPPTLRWSIVMKPDGRFLLHTIGSKNRP
jgi:cyclopropane-fatty-acyl-phospholipid synthase